MNRIASLHFIDGSKLSFDFPEQTSNTAGKQIKLADLVDSKHLVIEAEGRIFLFPVSSIKYVTFSVPDLERDMIGTLPRHAITGARLRD